MKIKHISKILLFILVFISSFILLRIERINSKKRAIQNALINISLEKLELITGNIDTESKVTLVLFHPSCDFCQADAKLFLRAKEALKDLEVLWISYDEKDSIQKFSKTYGLDSLPNMHFAHMNIETMLERYGNVKFPTFLTYNEQGQLVEKFIGLTKPEKILAAYQIPED